MKIELNKNFKKRAKGRFEKFSFEVGIIDDGPHKDAKRGQRGLKGQDVLSAFAGGPVRKKSRKSSNSLSEVSKAFRKSIGVNYLTEPFDGKGKNKDIVNFGAEYLKLAQGKSKNQNRIKNLLQAIVRNPILRGDYGPNSKLTQAIKGFDRAGIDTAQLFKAITTKVKARRW